MNTDFKIEDINPNLKYKSIINGDLARNMNPAYNNPVEDLNEYINNNNQKKLNVRDIIFSDNNTDENYAHNRNLNFKQMNFFPAFNYEEERINHPNSVRENKFDKNIIQNYYNHNINSKANHFSDDKLIFLGNEGINCYALKPKTDVDWNFDLINSTKKTKENRKYIDNQILESEDAIYNNSIINPKNEINDKNTNLHMNKIESNNDFDELVNRNHHTNNISNLSPITTSRMAFIKEKTNSSLKNDFNRNIQIDENKSIQQNLNNFNVEQKENPLSKQILNTSPQIRLLKEFTPKADNKFQNKDSKIYEETKFNQQMNIFDEPSNDNKDKSRFRSNIIDQQTINQPSMKFIHKEKAFNANNYCDQIGTLQNNKFSELLINQNALITQAKVCENNFIDSTKYNLENILPKVKTDNRIKSIIFNKSQNVNQYDDKKTLKPIFSTMNHDEYENNILNFDNSPSSISSYKLNKIVNPTQLLPSSIKKIDVIDSDFLFSSGINKKINDQMDLKNRYLDKVIINNELEENPKKFKIILENDVYKTNDKNHSKSKKEASNFRKKSNKKMTFAPSEFKHFSDLELNKSKEKNFISLIPEETESNITSINMINTPSINIKNKNIDYTKEKSKCTSNYTPLNRKLEPCLLKDNPPPISECK